MKILNVFRTDPDDFQETLYPVIGEVLVRPVKGSRLDAKIRMAQLNRLAMFTIKALPLRVCQEPTHEFYKLTIPLGMRFSVYEEGRHRNFEDNSAHLCRSDLPFDFSANTDSRALVVQASKKDLLEGALRLNPQQRSAEPDFAKSISFSDPEGHALLQSLAQLWSELYAEKTMLESSIATQELEDRVLTNLILAAQADPGRGVEPAAPKAVSLAEDYLTANISCAVSRADLADAVGMSIRSLSRGFVKRHGIGPMKFLKMRRLESAYKCLLGAEPGATTVTKVALNLGFNHLGKFAIEYRNIFGELPSRTLRR